MREYRQSQAGAVQSAARGSSAGDVLRENEQLHKTVLTGLMAALCYVAFTFLKIPVPTPGGGMVALHIGNAFCVLAALILGGVNGGLAGAIGMTDVFEIIQHRADAMQEAVAPGRGAMAAMITANWIRYRL